MRFAALWSLAAAALAVRASSSSSPAPTKTKRWDSGFVTVEDGQFIRNGEPFRFVGTNAYWLPSLNTDADINKTIHNISAAGIKVIRTWAFNDVDEIPVNGTWFQLIQNGTTTINNGSNGLQKLDKVVQFAEEAGVLLILSLTNNWNPLPLLDNTTVVPVDGALARRDVTLGTNNSLPRNTLSNDFGGMDAYVRAFSASREHSTFYQNETIVSIFKNYTTAIVSRYADSPAVLAWELANDPRCNSSIAASATCTTNTITAWHADVGAHVASVDPNHIVSSGAHGFQCMDCPKLFPLAPAPSTSAAPGRRKRAVGKPLTKEGLLAAVTARRKKTREVRKREMLTRGDGLRIRGRWIATRQADPSSNSGVGSAFDGSSGVDSQDILNIPSIGFGSFQLLPDQNSYDVAGADPSLSGFNNTIEEGVQWIQVQAQSAAQVGKPAVLTAFGLVTQDNAPFFVPFNTTIAPFNNTTPPSSNTSAGLRARADASYGASDAQQDSAYTAWLQAAAAAGVGGAVQYQWGTGGLTDNGGSSVDQDNDASGTTPNADTSGSSPNDGYRSAPTGDDGVASTLTDLSSLFG
ncbi:glycoside hydrolase family 5 protein [Phellopilus nigrolimitatus]|nr:glycoside hydrolase family 5 protein [Phellopilus nigrolimitatus]